MKDTADLMLYTENSIYNQYKVKESRTLVMFTITVFALRNSLAAPSGRIWKLPQMSGKVRRNVNIVNIWSNVTSIERS